MLGLLDAPNMRPCAEQEEAGTIFLRIGYEINEDDRDALMRSARRSRIRAVCSEQCVAIDECLRS